MVFRIYVEKKPALAQEADALLRDVRSFLGIRSLEKLRILNRYDAEGLDKSLFGRAVRTVFSEPQVDVTYDALPAKDGSLRFAVEYLPGQYDQRADSAAQCIQILSQGERPAIRTAKVYLLYGKLTEEEFSAIRRYVVNPVESREASLEKISTLAMQYDLPQTVAVLDGFCEMKDDALSAFCRDYSLAMDEGDLACCRDYFRTEGREPTITELRLIDTYWSDHCRHTTFHTILTDAAFDDPAMQKEFADYLALRETLGDKKPVTLMDLGTIAVKALKQAGRLDALDESEEINACTVRTTITVNGKPENWLLLFKNETHNHPTEIEPFGGAATCIGGAIRDPLSGRSYVYAAMRVTGAANPLTPIEETLPGKLPQKKIVTTAAAGYSSYGNQIGLATGMVDEVYHPGYAAKRMEIGAVVGAAKADFVRRERPVPGDVVILLGGRTGRDGCGGATGSSKSHTVKSLSDCGAEVQKGNAPEERKLQRLFRSGEAALLIKRCNDFGAGGVSVAVGELADGLSIDLDLVPKKYEGLDGTELAISESQERMAVVVDKKDAARFIELAGMENLEATAIAVVTEQPRLTMRWKGRTIVDISRAFLDTNGAKKHVTAHVKAPVPFAKEVPQHFADGMKALVSSLACCSRRGLSERFDSTIGAGSVLMPFGGAYQATPIQAMVHKFPVPDGETDDCSVMAWGFDPAIAEKSPYHAACLAVVESVCKLVAAGASFDHVYLTFQEYFEKLASDPDRWGKPLAALLGALRAQLALGVAAIGGKDSMSGTFENLTVPPTLVSFAITTAKTGEIVSPEMKGANHRVVLLSPAYDPFGVPEFSSLRALFDRLHTLTESKQALAVWSVSHGGAAEGIFKMCLGNRLGFAFSCTDLETLFAYRYGSFVVELADDAPDMGLLLGHTLAEENFIFQKEILPLDALLSLYEGKLESVYPTQPSKPDQSDVPVFSFSAKEHGFAKFSSTEPRVLIPVFPGTNCEYDAAKAFDRAGAKSEIFVVRNRSAAEIAESVEEFARRVAASQMVFLPGGFSGGDEPDGSGKFITAFFRNEAVKTAVHALLRERDGLMAGICNGFQALIKLGLVPYGEIRDMDESCPTLTFNTIGRHQSMLVRTRIASNRSPWLAKTKVGDLYTVPISHGEGRFLASDALIRSLAENGQIATQYVDANGAPTMDVRYNPNGSVCAIEGITSPDGRVFGKMGHSERVGAGLYQNVPGVFEMGMFESAVSYFKKV